MRDAASTYVTTVLSDQPVAYLPLDETTGMTAHDLVPNGPEGMILGPVLLGQAAPFSAAERAMSFNGTNGAIDLGNTFPFIGTAPYSIECWFLALSTQPVTFYEIISKWHQNDTDGELASGWNLFYTNSNDVDLTREASAGVPDLVVTPFQSGWHHVVGTYDGVNQTIYLDGMQRMSTAASLELQPVSEDLMIGAGNGDPTGVPMFGSIAQVAIYDHSLTAEQVLKHFAASVQ
jgi:Concanavalin A-like lectin/glucanases superfamily